MNFNTINVQSMSNMFAGATSFNQPLTFNTSNVQSMAFMFCGATSFNQPLNFDTANVVYTNYMFAYATSFNQNINNWNITKSNDTNNHNGFGKDSPIEFDFIKNPYLYIQSNYNGNI